MQLGSLSSFIEEAQRAASNFVNKSEIYIINALSNFRDKRGQLNYNISKLKANAPRTDAPQALKDAYSRALAQATDAKAKADWTGRIADEFTNITGLGALPAIIAGVPVAVLLAAVAGITVVVYNAVNEIGHYLGAAQAVEAARESNRDPLQALETYNRNAIKGGLFGDVSQLIWPVAIVGGLYLLYTETRPKRR